MDHHAHHHHSTFEAASMERCSMYMLWNWNIIDTCVVFKEWHIRSNFQFFLSFIAIVLMSCSYEWLRNYQGRVDRKIASDLLLKGKPLVRNEAGVSLDDPEEEPLLIGAYKAGQNSPVPTRARITRAALYGSTVFVSFFLMLVFMTYNAYLIFATVLGAAIGHFIFGAEMDVDAVLGGANGGKGLSCH